MTAKVDGGCNDTRPTVRLTPQWMDRFGYGLSGGTVLDCFVSRNITDAPSSP